MARCKASVRIAALATLLALPAAAASGQPLVATTGMLSDTCTNPSPASCTRGELYIANGNTLAIESTLDVWRGLSDVTFGALLVHPTGQRIFVGVDNTAAQPPTHEIHVINVPSMTTAAVYGVNGAGRAVSHDGTRLFVTATGAVLVVDSANGAPLATIPATQPSAVAVGRSGSRIYVIEGNAAIAVFDAVTYARLQTIPLAQFISRIELTPDDAHLYAVAEWASVYDIDTASNAVLGTITNFGGPTAPHDVSFARGRAYVAVSLQSPGLGGETISVIDVATRALVTTVPAVDPVLTEASTDGTRVWTYFLGEPRLVTIDTATNTILGRIAVPGGPIGIAAIPTQRLATVTIDLPSASQTVPQPFAFAGWAIDLMGIAPGPGVDTVHVWAFPANGGAPIFVGADYGRARPDVGALFGPTYTNSGFSLSVRGLPPGGYQLIAFGHSTRTNEFTIARSVSIAIAPSTRLVIDTPSPGAQVPLTFTLAGWALDQGAAAGVGIDAIHVWAFPASGAPPIFAGAVTLGFARPDVAAIFGSQFLLSGYALTISNLPPGSYRLAAFGHDPLSATFSVVQQITITVVAPEPIMFVDTPLPGATVSGSFPVAGWAIEYRAASGTGVDLIHVWAFPAAGGTPVFLGQAPYGNLRPDVGAIFGPQYAPSGFGFAVSTPLPPGAYNLIVYAHSTTMVGSWNLRIVPITVQ